MKKKKNIYNISTNVLENISGGGKRGGGGGSHEEKGKIILQRKNHSLKEKMEGTLCAEVDKAHVRAVRGEM